MDKPIDTFGDNEKAELRNSVFGFVADFALVERYRVYKNMMISLSYSKRNSNQK